MYTCRGITRLKTVQMRMTLEAFMSDAFKSAIHQSICGVT